jgi:hypothetical protein
MCFKSAFHLKIKLIFFFVFFDDFDVLMSKIKKNLEKKNFDTFLSE